MLLLPAHISHFLYTCFVRLYPEFLGSGNGRPRERRRRPPAAGDGRTAKSASDGWKGVAAAAAGGRSQGEVGGQQRATPRGYLSSSCSSCSSSFPAWPRRNPKWGHVSFSVRASAAAAPAAGCDAAGDGGWGWRRPPCRRSCGANALTASSGDAFPSPANSCSHLLRSCLERRAATSSCSPSPSCRLVTAPHGGRGERGLWRLMSKREGCLPSGSEGPSSPQPMTPCRPPHLIEASSSSAKVACTRQRSSDGMLGLSLSF